MVALAAVLWRATPGSLVPDEDQGFYIAAVILPDGSSLQRTDKVVSEVTQAMLSNKNNLDVVAFTGLDFLGGGLRNNAATIFVTQIPWDQRKGVTTQDVVGDFFMKTGHIKEGLAIAFAPPAIFGLGAAGGAEFYIRNRGEGGPQALAQAMGGMLGASAAGPDVRAGNSLWKPNVPQLFVDVDREKAKALGVSVDEIFNTLSATLGSYYVNDFNKYGRTWQVLMSAEPTYRNRPDDIGAVWVRSERNEMVPLRSVANVQYTSGPDSLDRYNNVPAVKVFASAAPGISSGQVIQKLQQVAQQTLPPDFDIEFTGASLQEQNSSGTSGLALGLAAVMVFLILAAQYEKWSLPFSVLMALPFGTFGALAAVWLRDMTNDVYFQIGLVTLLGLGRKERDPDRRVRVAESVRGLLDCRRGDRSGASAV